VIARNGYDTQYLSESARPLTSLTFVIPLLIVYEAGLLFIGPLSMRNGAEVWLRQLLDWLGFGQYFLLPLLTCFVLIAWQHLTHQPWHFSHATLPKMFGETVLFALVLLVFGQFQSWLLVTLHLPNEGRWTQVEGIVPQTVGCFGAGIYEELLFRLMIIPTLAGSLQWLGESRRASLVASAVVSSAVFAAAHYRAFTGHGEELLWATFFFRFLAGILFATLFIFRGFGVTAGAHTLYDVLVSWIGR
jgi:membrane protease YdiL (CAAX protease family)